MIYRFRTDARVAELTGVVTDGNQSVQTLIIDGALAPPKVLSSGLGLSGGDYATIRVDFGSTAIRDIWLETAMEAAYLRIGASDTLFSSDYTSEPQLTVVGDSYLQKPSNAFGNGGALALELAARLGVRNVAIDSIGGTGYWNSGQNLGNFNDRLVGHGTDASAVYLVIGGLNDYGDALPGGTIAWPTTSTYEDAVIGYFAGLRRMNPDAVIIGTAPFCPNPPMSDSSYVVWPGTNSSGLGDFLYKAGVHKKAVQNIAGPWIYIDVLMGTGWINSSGATGDMTGLQWFTGGTPGAGTTSSYKPGNTNGGTGGGFGGIASVPVISGGAYSQAPDLIVSGGSGAGLMLASRINSSGLMTSVVIVSPGAGYTSAGLPQITIDPRFELQAAAPGTPLLIAGINPDGQYPLSSFAPSGSGGQLNDAYAYIMPDLVHPSPPGVSYLSTRLARDIYAAVMAL